MTMSLPNWTGTSRPALSLGRRKTAAKPEPSPAAPSQDSISLMGCKWERLTPSDAGGPVLEAARDGGKLLVVAAAAHARVSTGVPSIAKLAHPFH